MVTEYLGNTENGCKYNYNKLKDVLYLVSAEHVKDVQIDNGEAYISGLTELPLRINGFNIQFNEETSLDERYKFQKTITLSMNGYVNYRIFGGRYYAILEAEDGTYFMVNVDFPSRITHTFHLSKDVNQTDFTFSSLSNFPTLKLNAEFEAVSPVCLGFRVNGIQSLQLIEKEKARLDTENRTVISTEPFNDIEFLGDSCSFEEIYDGFKVTDTIEFNILLDNYKPSWEWQLLEFLENKYSAIIVPKGNDNKFYPGFNFGLEPSYTIQTASQRGQSDIITVVLREASAYGTTAANDWDEDQDTETRWRWVKQVGDTICYECIGIKRARYLVRQQVDAFGNPTGDYQVMEGYESQYPNFNIVGTFTTEQEFDSLDCDETGVCNITTNIPGTISYNAVTCYTYNLRTSCDWQIKNIPGNITVTPSAGLADTDYTVTICQTDTPPSELLDDTMLLTCCKATRLIHVKTQSSLPCIRPTAQTISCSAQTVQFAYDGTCRLDIVSIDPRLTYTVQNNIVSISVPKNEGDSAVTYTIVADNCNCSSGNISFNITQNKCDGPTPPPVEPIYQWKVVDGEYLCGECNPTKAILSTSSSQYTISGTGILTAEETSGGTAPNRQNVLNAVVTDGCTGIGEYAFGCIEQYGYTFCFDRLEFVRLPNTVASIGDKAFLGAGAMTECQIPYGCQSIGASAFTNCTSLMFIDIPDTVTSIGSSAFSNCLNFRYCSLSSGLTAIPSYCFQNCDGLETIEIPSGVTEIGEYAFNACDGLRYITINATTPPYLSGSNLSYNNTFPNNGCPIYVPAESVDAYKAEGRWLVYKNRIYPIPNE